MTHGTPTPFPHYKHTLSLYLTIKQHFIAPLRSHQPDTTILTLSFTADSAFKRVFKPFTTQNSENLLNVLKSHCHFTLDHMAPIKIKTL